MSKYTAEQVRDWHREMVTTLNSSDVLWTGAWAHALMADAIDALLREREAAKAGVTDGMVDAAMLAYNVACHSQGDMRNAHVGGMQAALEAVAPMLASARVPEGWTDSHSQVQRFALQRFMAQAYDLASVAGQDLKERFFTSGATAKFLADAKTAEECLAMLTAAPKPEKE